MSKLFSCLSATLIITALFFSQVSPCGEKGQLDKFKRAILKIIVRHKGIPVDSGTGIFISNDGKLIAPFKLMQRVIGDEDFTAEFISNQNGVLNKFDVFQCDNQQKNEICLLKLKVKPSSWFNLNPIAANKQNDVLSIMGHTSKEDFVTAQSSLIQPHFNTNGYTRFTLSNSSLDFQEGAAILNKKNQLIGMKVHFRNGFNYTHNEAVSLEFVSQFIVKENLAYDPIDFYRNHYKISRQEKIAELTKTYIDPAYIKIYGRIDLSSQFALFQEIHFGLSQTYRGYIPNSFFNCTQEPDALLCEDREGIALFSIQEKKVNRGFLTKLEGKNLEESKSLRYVELLKTRNEWKTFEAQLTPEQKNFLFSAPRPVQCGGLKTALVRLGLPAQNSCNQAIYQDGSLNINTYILFAQEEDHLFKFSITVWDPLALKYYFQIPPVFFLSLKKTGVR